MAKFGLDKSVPLQGGHAAPNVRPPRTGVPGGKGSGSTPGLTQDAMNTNVRPAPQGASGVKGGPKSFGKGK